MKCGRCGKPIADDDRSEACGCGGRFCEGALCGSCWEEYGYCHELGARLVGLRWDGTPRP